MTADDIEDARAAETYRRAKEVRAAYRQAKAIGGPMADALNRPERIPPGCVGWTAEDDDVFRKLHRPRGRRRGRSRPPNPAP
jgi:hypothetical protein